MAKKISQLPLASAVSGTDSFEIVQGGVSKRMEAAGAWTLGSLIVSGTLRTDGLLTATAGLTVSTGNLTMSAGQIVTSSAGIGTNGAVNIPFLTNGITRWIIQNTTGHFLANTDNTVDIGSSGASRPRTGYFGTSVVAPVITSVAGTNLELRAGSASERWTLINPGGHLIPSSNTNTQDLGRADALIRTGYFGTSVVTPLVGTGASSGITFTTSGGTQFIVQHLVSAVNYISVQGRSVGAGPWFETLGSDTDIAMNFVTKGAGSFYFQTNTGFSEVQLEISRTASAVRRIIVTGAAAGGNPTISTSAGSLAITPAIVAASSIQTGAPSGGTAAAWKFGIAAVVSPTSPNRTIELDVGGAIYYLHAKTTNN